MAKKEKREKPRSKKSKRKIIKIVISLAVVAALVVCGIIFIPNLIGAEEDSAATLQKRTSTVINGDVVKTIGSSAPLESSNSEIYKPDETSEVLEILIEEGNLAKEGDVILTLDTSQTDDTIENLEAQIETKQEQIEGKEDQIDDKNDAIDDKQEDIADKYDDIADLEESISDLEADIDENESTRADLNIYAPIDGTIFNISAEVGDSVNSSTVLATVTDTVSYEVELTFTAKILNETIEDIIVYYKNNKLDADIISIADYTYKDKFQNEMVDVLVSFTTDISLPEKDDVVGIIYLEVLSYQSKDGSVPYYDKTESITSGVSGEILELYLTEKQSVEAGSLLAVIDGESIDNITDAFNNQIESLEEQIENARDMITGYYENIDTYYEDIADYNDEIVEIKDDIEEIEAEIEEAKEGYESANVVAEFDGIVSSFKVEEGDTVNANTTMFTLISLDNPSMIVAVDELDIAQLEIGQEAEVVIDALTDTETTPVNAIVTDIAMEGNYSNGVTTYDVTVMLVDSVDGLKLSMNATATIYIDKSEDTLYIPIEAITLQNGKSFVYVQDDSAVGTPVTNNTNTDNTTSDTQQAAGNKAGGARQGNFNTDDMTDEQKAAMAERLASMGISEDDMQNQTGAVSESVSDMADYYIGSILVEVTTGIYNELYIEILDGLDAGDVVVLPPLYTSDSSDSTIATGGMMNMGGITGIGTGTDGVTRQRPTGGFGGN